MIRKLRIKIIIVITFILTLAVFGIMLSVNIMEHAGNQQLIQTKIQRIAEQDGIPPTTRDPYNPFSDSEEKYADCFSIQFDTKYTVRRIVLTRDIEVNQSDIVSYANQALSSGESFGELGHYAYYLQSRYYGMILVFMDISSYQQAQENLLFSTSIIGVMTILLFFLLAIILAFWLVKPVKDTFEKQKLFISNASHELKTPLAVIGANVDVLEMEIGENKWLNYIRSENTRMSELVNELLCLARLDDKSGHPMVMTEFSLTDIFLQTVLPFESKVFEMHKQLNVEAQPDIVYKGDESAIKHVLTILIDNAIKYSDEHGTITARLYTHANKKIMEIHNTGEGVPKEQLDKIFERFYRRDEARNSKSGGYGLGLAIAKATVQAHGGRIVAQSDFGHWMKFTVTL